MPLVHHELCFGCGRVNLFGLLLEAQPESARRLTGRCFIKQDHQGAEPGAAHDGIVAAALSEAMGLACGISARAQTVQVDHFASAPIGTYLDVVARVEDTKDGVHQATAQASSVGSVIARARGTYRRG